MLPTGIADLPLLAYHSVIVPHPNNAVIMMPTMIITMIAMMMIMIMMVTMIAMMMMVVVVVVGIKTNRKNPTGD